ncbi:unnamed protein product [Chondrus crispus]|uniref:Uncharacterized protein n=1 Tax=Chondrus crispus TaxID=2769 RepID=R7QR23_CHOCR|nr:unnamed protein product [Chondrus crispus]CDF40569.1 unnamed protein product [Chondrus crispus]|eukprot:XP_005710863.1 unnamed protein product [Chondrus crispus]
MDQIVSPFQTARRSKVTLGSHLACSLKRSGNLCDSHPWLAPLACFERLSAKTCVRLKERLPWSVLARISVVAGCNQRRRQACGALAETDKMITNAMRIRASWTGGDDESVERNTSIESKGPVHSDTTDTWNTRRMVSYSVEAHRRGRQGTIQRCDGAEGVSGCMACLPTNAGSGQSSHWTQLPLPHLTNNQGALTRPHIATLRLLKYFF